MFEFLSNSTHFCFTKVPHHTTFYTTTSKQSLFANVIFHMHLWIFLICVFINTVWTWKQQHIYCSGSIQVVQLFLWTEFLSYKRLDRTYYNRGQLYTFLKIDKNAKTTWCTSYRNMRNRIMAVQYWVGLRLKTLQFDRELFGWICDFLQNVLMVFNRLAEFRRICRLVESHFFGYRTQCAKTDLQR